MKHCKKCLLPENVEGAVINSHGICNFCIDFTIETEQRSESERQLREEDLEKALKECKGKSEYDCQTYRAHADMFRIYEYLQKTK